MKTKKHRCDMSIAELIVDSGWWLQSEKEWQALPMPEREDIAFIRTGCRVAYPTWERPVDCVHLECRIRRGELPKIALTNAVLRGEKQSGWLRFNEDRKQVAKIFREFRKLARQTGQYDPWKIPGGWQLIVFTGVQS